MSNVRDGDTLILRLKSVHNLLRNYGKPSYVPYHEQTDKGLAKFYSILRYLVSKLSKLYLKLSNFNRQLGQILTIVPLLVL